MLNWQLAATTNRLFPHPRVARIPRGVQPAAFSTADRNVARRSHPQSARSLQAFYLKTRGNPQPLDHHALINCRSSAEYVRCEQLNRQSPKQLIAEAALPAAAALPAEAASAAGAALQQKLEAGVATSQPASAFGAPADPSHDKALPQPRRPRPCPCPCPRGHPQPRDFPQQKAGPQPHGHPQPRDVPQPRDPSPCPCHCPCPCACGSPGSASVFDTWRLWPGRIASRRRCG